MKYRLYPVALAVVVVVMPDSRVAAAQLLPTAHTLTTPLSMDKRELLDEAMRLFDASYDAQAHLVVRPHDGHRGVTQYMVRESSWYALGLLLRDSDGKHPGDSKRALDLLRAVLDNQYLDPQTKWYGTFKRSPEDAGPKPGAKAFTSYDPNWRHFVGTTFEMVLIEYPDKVPAPLKERMYRAIDAAVTGEMHEGRLVPSYTNIALMYGALWNFAAIHDNNQEWLKESGAWADEVFRLFEVNDTFSEFNAPTYYGVDLYGLGLWREYGSTEHMRDMGRTMEAGLWRDIAEFYHAGLRNMAGPYDRAYGMDMSVYMTPTGVWLRSVMSAATAPMPEHPTFGTWQVADIWYAPQVVLLGTHVPTDAMATFKKFSGPHMVDRTIDAQRTATAWLGETAMWGSESTSRTKDTGNKTQFHPATAQWRMTSGEIGWMKVTRSPDIDAVADRKGITLATNGDITIRVFYGKATPELTRSYWMLPGMGIGIQTDATGFSTKPAEDCEGCTDLLYTGVKSLRMDFSQLNAPGSGR